MFDPAGIDELRAHLTAAELATRLRIEIDALDAAVDDLVTALRIDDVAAIGRAACALRATAELLGATELADAVSALEVDESGVPRLTRPGRRDQAAAAIAAWRWARAGVVGELRRAQADAQSET